MIHDDTRLATKVTQILPRDNGTEVRIIVEEMYGKGLHPSVKVMVHRRDTPESPWVYCNDQPHPDWRRMSVDDYLSFGRAEMLYHVTWGEILKVGAMIGKPLSELH